MDMIEEQTIEELSKKVVEEVSVQHPIMYDTHNICELVACSKLSRFSVQMIWVVQILQFDLTCYTSVIRLLLYHISSITIHAHVPKLALTPLAVISKKCPCLYQIGALCRPDNFLN